jgi:hypothetical protein
MIEGGVGGNARSIEEWREGGGGRTPSTKPSIYGEYTDRRPGG